MEDVKVKKIRITEEKKGLFLKELMLPVELEEEIKGNFYFRDLKGLMEESKAKEGIKAIVTQNLEKKAKKALEKELFKIINKILFQNFKKSERCKELIEHWKMFLTSEFDFHKENVKGNIKRSINGLYSLSVDEIKVNKVYGVFYSQTGINSTDFIIDLNHEKINFRQSPEKINFPLDTNKVAEMDDLKRAERKLQKLMILKHQIESNLKFKNLCKKYINVIGEINNV
jgi:hypothetical protein